jgi:hypothetical protein
MTEREALQLATGIVRQHNLNVTASDAERMATLDRLVDWLNYVAYPALSQDNELPGFLVEEQSRTIEDLRRFAKITA